MIYVDQLRTHQSVKGEARRWGREWCHLWSDESDAELHAFAKRIGLLRKWFQPHSTLNHYDLARSRRDRALIAGAVEVELKDYLRRRRLHAKKTA